MSCLKANISVHLPSITISENIAESLDNKQLILEEISIIISDYRRLVDGRFGNNSNMNAGNIYFTVIL